MASPVIFNFFDYLKNPIADFCVSNYESKTIYTLDDLLPEIQKLNHSRWALEKGCKSYIGDQLRLKLATENDDFFYADADVFIPNLSDITKHKNCTDFIPEQNIINNGTFFYTDKDCKFNSYYLNVYNHLPKEDYYLCNYSIFKKYPFELKLESKKSADMNLLDNNKTRHFLLNLFYRFAERYKDLDVIYYTKNPNTKRPIIWQIENCPPYIGAEHSQEWSVWYFDTIYDFIPQDDMIRLFKEQMEFTYQKKLKFVEV